MMKTIFAVLLLVSVCAAEDYDYSDCQCVPYYQCNIDGTMNDDGEGIIDIREGFVGTVDNPSSRKQCDHYLSVCCLKEEMVPGGDVSPPEPPTGGHEGEQGGHQEPPTGGHGGEQGGHQEPTTGGHGGNQNPPTGGHGGNQEPPTGGHQGNQEPPTGGHGGNQNPPTGGHGGNQNPPTGGHGGNQELPTGGHQGNQEPPIGGHGGNQEPPTGGHQEPPTGGHGGNQNPPTGGHGEGGHQEPPTGGHGGNQNPSTGGHGEGGHQEPPTGGHGGRPKPKPHVNKGCGYRNPNGIGFRITGAFNNEANFAEFPWMVAILRATNIGGNIVNTYQCGGSLIHPRAVLTAAHCVQGKAATELSIRAGEWDTQTVSEPLPHQDRNVSVVISHPRYNYKNLHNDFALLILEKPVELADNVEIVCLPESNEYFDNNKCFATGWGKTEFGDKGKYQVILKAVELPAVAHDKCQFLLRKTRLGPYFKLDQSFMCAGGVKGIDTCTGDGGSPLVCPLPHDPTRYTQAGIVAWGIGCGKNDVPGVYGDVTKARQWIDEMLAPYNIYSSSYSPGANNNYPPIEGSEATGHGAQVPSSHGAQVPSQGH